MDVRDRKRGARWGAVLVLAVPALFGIIWVSNGCTAPAPPAGDPPRIARRLPWHHDGVWLHGDLHVHNLIDVRKALSIAGGARSAGLDFVASTEHAERAFDAQTAAILAALRREFPELIVLFGIEWNLPGSDHASVVVETRPDEVELLRDFSVRFDRKVQAGMLELDPDSSGETWGEFEQSVNALRWLAARQAGGGPRAVVYANHPSKWNLLSTEQIAALQEAGLAGVEAAPGHQNHTPPGVPRNHPREVPLVDRYEPFVAVIGGGYDTLLAEGRFLGLAAGSDFHVKRTSYLPGVFSRTLVLCPDRTPAGIVAGLTAGSTATVLGRIVSAVETRLGCASCTDTARIGEELVVPRGTAVVYRIEAEVPPRDFEDRDNRLDAVEVISNCLGAPAVVQRFEQLGHGAVRRDFALPASATAESGRCFLRARGRRVASDAQQTDLLFYTGATFLRIE